MGMIQPLQKEKNKQNDTKGKNKSIESKFQKKFVKFNPNKSKPSNKTTLKKKTPITPTYYKCGKVGQYIYIYGEKYAMLINYLLLNIL